MNTFTQKWSLVTLLEQCPDGTEFAYTNWPTHITLADVFSVSWNNTLQSQLVSLFAKYKPISLVVSKPTLLGPSANPVQVMTFEENIQLKSLHNDIIELLINHGAVFNNPSFTKSGYIAHCSFQETTKLSAGLVVSIHNATIIDMYPNDDGYMRKATKTIPFDSP